MKIGPLSHSGFPRCADNTNEMVNNKSLTWNRDSETGRWTAEGVRQDYRISGTGRNRSLHTFRKGARYPMYHTKGGTVTACKARAEYLETNPKPMLRRIDGSVTMRNRS